VPALSRWDPVANVCVDDASAGPAVPAIAVAAGRTKSSMTAEFDDVRIATE
jgi:hypothetical protein